MLATLSIPLCAILILAGGALMAFPWWMAVPGFLLFFAGFLGFVFAVIALCPSAVLRGIVCVLLFVPMLATAPSGTEAAQAAVLTARGVATAGTIVRIKESHGKTTTYRCTVHYNDRVEGPGYVRCGKDDRVGDRVRVLQDPEEMVDPHFDRGAGWARREVSFAVSSGAALLVISLPCVAIGAVLRRRGLRSGAAAANP
ncbi:MULTISPECIES: DUF3592 domain-containing protein [unclassified Streptomyces]|uniref:DUF3592 domain-containing protein n=1 Tax=unclassified Streptomyces TaxID=2593676 RepID=UPI00131A1723|nr:MULTISPECIES: DUF3592 domain-containing protein [unclassified Streptomyces]MYT33931.1 hypothetical protein [Streptomyces sp. SID8354]